jgi:hypothetical protein
MCWDPKSFPLLENLLFLQFDNFKIVLHLSNILCYAYFWLIIFNYMTSPQKVAFIIDFQSLMLLNSFFKH